HRLRLVATPQGPVRSLNQARLRTHGHALDRAHGRARFRIRVRAEGRSQGRSRVRDRGHAGSGLAACRADTGHPSPITYRLICEKGGKRGLNAIDRSVNIYGTRMIAEGDPST